MWAFAGFPFAFGFITCLSTMVILFITTLKLELHNRRWDFRSSRNSNDRQQSQRYPRRNNMSSMVRDKGLMYSFSFLLTWTPTLILEIDRMHELDIPWVGHDNFLKMSIAVFLPLQGTFNLAIYTMPKWKPYVYNCCGEFGKHVWHVPISILSMVCKCCSTSATHIANLLQKYSAIVAEHAEKDGSNNQNDKGRTHVSTTGRTDSHGNDVVEQHQEDEENDVVEQHQEDEEKQEIEDEESQEISM